MRKKKTEKEKRRRRKEKTQKKRGGGLTFGGWGVSSSVLRTWVTLPVRVMRPLLYWTQRPEEVGGGGRGEKGGGEFFFLRSLSRISRISSLALLEGSSERKNTAKRRLFRLLLFFSLPLSLPLFLSPSSSPTVMCLLWRASSSWAFEGVTICFLFFVFGKRERERDRENR